MSPWSDLFRFRTGGSRLKADPRLRWFGKLPTYADYYSSQADADWAVEFNDWLLKGYEMYYQRQRETAGGGSRRSPLPICAVVARLPRSGMTALATVQDYGGDMRGRPFPIAFYVGLPSEQWLGPTSVNVVGGLDILHYLIDLRHEIIRFFKAPARFEGIFGGRELPLETLTAAEDDELWLTQARRLPLSDWLEAVRPGLTCQDPLAWLRLTEKWGQTIASLESESFEPTLCFPLAGNVPWTMQVSGWLRWLEAFMALSRRSLSLVFTAEPGAGVGRLAVIARELVQEDFLLLTPLYSSLSYLDDASRLKDGASDGEAGAPSTAETAETAAGRPEPPAAAVEGSWADFVTRRPRVGEATTQV